MNLNKLFDVFKQKKLSYIDAKVHDGGVFFHASTGYNGRGNAIEVRIFPDGIISMEVWSDKTKYELANISEEVCLDKISKAW